MRSVAGGLLAVCTGRFALLSWTTTGGLGDSLGNKSCWSRFDIVCSGAGPACLRIICICCCGGSCWGSGGGAKGSQEELEEANAAAEELDEANAQELLEATGAAEELEEANAEELLEATGAAEELLEATGAAELLEEATGLDQELLFKLSQGLHSAKSDPDQLIPDAVRDDCLASHSPDAEQGV